MGGVATPSRRGRPLATNAKVALISSLRILFRDLRRWKLVGPLQIDPAQDLAVPKPWRGCAAPIPAISGKPSG
jgi:hypothetical protein